MINRRLIAAGVSLIGSAVGMILAAAHTKEEMIDLRRSKWEDMTGIRERKEKKLSDGLAEYRETPGAVLLDVREKEDFDTGHIPGSIHAELRTVQHIDLSSDTPVFIVCYRGTRSAMAAAMLREAGFHNVQDIGGMEWYHGELET